MYKNYSNISDGISVDGGCEDDDKPSLYQMCAPSCGEQAHCTDGTCVCNSNFAGM